MSQQPLAQKVLSSNSSQSGMSVIPAVHHSEASSDEEGLYHTPPSISPESSLSVSSHKATSAADFESTVVSGSLNGSCEFDMNSVQKAISESGKSSTDPKEYPGAVNDTVYTQDNTDQKTRDINVESTFNPDDVHMETTSVSQPVQEKSKSDSATQGNGSASKVDITTISHQDDNNKPATDNNSAETKQEESASGASIIASVSQQGGSNKPAIEINSAETEQEESVSNVTASVSQQGDINSKPVTDNPTETKQDESSPIVNVETISQQVDNHTTGADKNGCPAVGNDSSESSTLPTDYVGSNGESSALEDKNNTEGNINPHLDPMLSAINPPQDKVINIYFKVILPKAAWGWDNNSIFIWFIHLGSHFGPGLCTHIDENLLLVDFGVKMPIDMIGSADYIFYKYAMHSRRMEHEYLHGAQIDGVADTRFICRALKIDHSKCFPGG